MSGNKFISQCYISIYESFCNFPVPDNPFSLLIPTEDDEECDDPLDALDELDDLSALGDCVLDLIDADINDEPISWPPDSFPGFENGFHSSPEDSLHNTASTPPSTADNKQPLPIQSTVGTFSPTKLPEWLVRPEAFDDTTHHLCTVEVQDYSAKRMKLLCMHVAEKVTTGCPNATITKNTKKTVESVSRSVKESTIPKVSHVVQQPKAKQSSAMKNSSEERPIKPAKEAGITLVNEKLWNHLHKLSKINVPVLDSSFHCGSTAPSKSRRKQILVPQIVAIESTKVKLEPILNEGIAEEPVPIVSKVTSMQVTDSEVVPVEQTLATSIENGSETSSRVLENLQNIRSCTKKMLHKNIDKVTLDKKSRKLFKNCRPGSANQHQRYS